MNATDIKIIKNSTMKHIKFLFAIGFMAIGYYSRCKTEAQKVEICSGVAGADATYVKDFVVQLEEHKEMKNLLLLNIL